MFGGAGKDQIVPACRLLQNHFQSAHAGEVVDFFVDGEQRQFVLRGSRHDGAVARIAVVPVERSKNAGSLTPSDPEDQAKGRKLWPRKRGQTGRFALGRGRSRTDAAKRLRLWFLG